MDILRRERFIQMRGNLAHARGDGRPRISQEAIHRVKSIFKNNHFVSIGSASFKFQLSPTSDHCIWHEITSYIRTSFESFKI